MNFSIVIDDVAIVALGVIAAAAAVLKTYYNKSKNSS